MTIIEQIKAEIERQIKDPQEHCYGVSSINKLRELLDFIDTLESENPVPNDLKDAVENYIYKAANTPGDDWITDDIRNAFFAGYKLHEANAPLPEDTVLFSKGVEEGKRLMMEDAVEIGTTDIYWEPDGDRAFPTFDPPVEDLLMPDIISQKFNDGDKVRIIILPKED